MPSANTMPSPDADPSQFTHLDAVTRERVRELQTAKLPPRTLRRTGLRPYAFNGDVMATICGVTSVLPYWYDLSIHRTVSGTYVSDIRLFHKSADHADLFRVQEHDDLEAAFRYFEAYEPSGDLAASDAMLTGSTSNATLALHTAHLQMRINQITDHYRALVAALLNFVGPGTA